MPKFDAEVLAMNRALKVLAPLAAPARARVVRALHERFVAGAEPMIAPPADPNSSTMTLTCEHGVRWGDDCLRCHGVSWEATPTSAAP